MAEIEICTCAETLGFDCDATGLTEKEAASHFCDLMVRAVGDDLGHQVEWAQGQRMLHHGWRGAHFTKRGTGWGTFDDLTPEEEKAIDDAAEKCWNEVDAVLEKSRKACAE